MVVNGDEVTADGREEVMVVNGDEVTEMAVGRDEVMVVNGDEVAADGREEVIVDTIVWEHVGGRDEGVFLVWYCSQRDLICGHFLKNADAAPSVQK